MPIAPPPQYVLALAWRRGEQVRAVHPLDNVRLAVLLWALIRMTHNPSQPIVPGIGARDDNGRRG